jgi:integrase
MGLAAVRDLREARAPGSPEELAAFETDVLAGFVLARAAAGLSDRTISLDVWHLEQARAWFGRPLWEMQPADADAYFGKVLRGAAKGTRLSRAQSLKTYFMFLELRHKAAIYQLTGCVAECPVDEMNRPRGGPGQAALRIPPEAGQVARLFAGWRQELATCRKFAPAARNYAAARLMADVGLRVNEARCLDLADVKWELGRFGKLHVRHGKGARGSGPRERMVPLINDAGRTLRWFIADVRGLFGDDYGTALRCCPASGITLTGPRGGPGRRRCGPGWPRRPPLTCQSGGTASPRMCCGTSARPSFTWAGWTCWRSSRSWAIPGSRPRWPTCTSTPPISRMPGSPGRNAPPCGWAGWRGERRPRRGAGSPGGLARMPAE